MTFLLTELGTPLLAGLLATSTPCVLPLYPGFLAYLTARAQLGTAAPWLGAAVLAGVISMMLLLGSLLAALSLAIGSVVRILTPLADVVLIMLGTSLLLGRNPFLRLSHVQVPAVRGPYAHAYLYGLLYGPIVFPCAAPLALAVFAFSLSAGQFVEHLRFFLLFGLGLGLPLFLLALLAHGRRQALVRLVTRHQRQVNVAAGALLLLAGGYDLWANREFLALYLHL